MADLDGFRIYIPTRGRVHQQTTLRSLPHALREITTLVCPREEKPALTELHRSKHDWDYRVEAQPSSIDNIADKRAWIMKKLAVRDGVKRAVMIDDDCYFFARCDSKNRRWDDTAGMWIPNSGYRLLSVAEATPAKLVGAFRVWNGLLRNAPHAGLCSRNGNHLEKREVATNGRMMHAIGYDVETFGTVVRTNRGIRVREDFDYTLQLLSKGYSNYIIYHTCVSPGSYGAKGGCSDERTVAMSNEQAELLAKLHPGLVRVVEKQYDNHPRLEVICSWKKAFEQQRNSR